MVIDWSNPNYMVSKHFAVKEALYLPTWGRMATEADGLDDTVKSNLIDLFKRLDQLRDVLGKPIRIHVAFRPDAYNKLIGGAPDSAHKYGKAADFDVEGMSCDEV